MSKILFGFHAVTARLRQSASSIEEICYDNSRRDQRMQSFIEQAAAAKVKLVAVDSARLEQLAAGQRHQGLIARVQPLVLAQHLDDLLEDLEQQQETPFLLILDGVTDPHNLGACLRVADAAGVHAVIAPKDRAVGLNATVHKVASGAADSVPYFMVTNLARTLRTLQARGIWVIGTAGEATQTLYQTALTGPLALVLGAEGEGLRRLTRETCDALIQIPMQGTVESLNVSVASGICLFEACRQRLPIHTSKTPVSAGHG
ncbi:23S rRNA (guanosine(2251)-2'-O)-methyltransferase RlmB [Parvibium lacunae]|uniref:23S rRNA (guanosine-2'-O-)-methyltransferase RlmB n=1 Tax=Parvibium lacunae TaxID=1888893 RepID=A0A368L7K7_9BURK|nr:23S rRNA (guanosine(2251)-2'-O)-methyltransferase RlmB [Parvibium lacunae]RCS59597.1 23S rRNA (guanosine(2251)-2'-O)-methyltransferase RlmB [Parvibium lacunae]